MVQGLTCTSLLCKTSSIASCCAPLRLKTRATLCVRVFVLRVLRGLEASARAVFADEPWHLLGAMRLRPRRIRRSTHDLRNCDPTQRTRIKCRMCSNCRRHGVLGPWHARLKKLLERRLQIRSTNCPEQLVAGRANIKTSARAPMR